MQLVSWSVSQPASQSVKHKHESKKTNFNITNLILILRDVIRASVQSQATQDRTLQKLADTI